MNTLKPYWPLSLVALVHLLPALRADYNPEEARFLITNELDAQYLVSTSKQPPGLDAVQVREVLAGFRRAFPHLLSINVCSRWITYRGIVLRIEESEFIRYLSGESDILNTLKEKESITDEYVFETGPFVYWKLTSARWSELYYSTAKFGELEDLDAIEKVYSTLELSNGASSPETYIEMEQIDEGIVVGFHHGWGDCPSGCINHYTWKGLLSDGEVFILEDPGRTTTRDQGFSYTFEFPYIVGSAKDQIALVGESASFQAYVDPAFSYETLTFRWLKDGTIIREYPATQYSNTDTYTIDGVSKADAGIYTAHIWSELTGKWIPGGTMELKVMESEHPWWGFGRYDFNYPWIWEVRFGWMYAGGTSREDAWFWQDELGWIWTDRSNLYPYLYSYDRESWLLYWARDPATTSPLDFYDFRKGEWFSISFRGND